MQNVTLEEIENPLIQKAKCQMVQIIFPETNFPGGKNLNVLSRPESTLT